MTEPVKMWAVVRDDGFMVCAEGFKEIAWNTSTHLDSMYPENKHTVKPCEARIIEDDQRD